MDVNPEHILEIKELISTGDIELSERRQAFKSVMGRDTILNDEQLTLAIAATDDDDDELFAKNVCAIEGAGFAEDNDDEE